MQVLRIKRVVRRYRNFWWMKRQSYRAIHLRLVRLMMFLFFLCSIHTLAMVWLESMFFSDALWLTLTTVTTVGYGDFSAVTPMGRLATVSLMYLAGISVMAQVVGEFIDYRIERRQRMIAGKWRWNRMQDHILVVNVPSHDTDRYLSRLIRQIRTTPGISHKPIQLLTTAFPDGLPLKLCDFGVVHRHVRAADSVRELEKANISKAFAVLVLAEDAYNARSDSVSLDILCHLQALNYAGHLVVEAIRDDNKSRFKTLGAKSVLRPVRAYPELMVRALVAPGSEIILEDLFTYGGVRPERVDIDLNGAWGDIASALIKANLGLPLGFVNHQGDTQANPLASQVIDASALLIMVNDDQKLDRVHVMSALAEFA